MLKYGNAIGVYSRAIAQPVNMRYQQVATFSEEIRLIASLRFVHRCILSEIFADTAL